MSEKVRHTCTTCKWLSDKIHYRSGIEGGGESWKEEVCKSPGEKRFNPLTGWEQGDGDIWTKNKDGYCKEWEAR